MLSRAAMRQDPLPSRLAGCATAPVTEMVAGCCAFSAPASRLRPTKSRIEVVVLHMRFGSRHPDERWQSSNLNRDRSRRGNLSYFPPLPDVSVCSYCLEPCNQLAHHFKLKRIEQIASSATGFACSLGWTGVSSRPCAMLGVGSTPLACG
jgi:hypothetical protein